MRRFATLVSLPIAALLAACAAGGPRSPSASVEYPWQDIRAEQSAMVISGAADHRHRAHQIGSRYQEIAVFNNGANVTYEVLEGIHAVFSMTGADVIKSWYATDSAKQAGFVYKNKAVRRSGEAFALSDSGTNRTCSLYARVFGGKGYGGEGDQVYRITYCIPSAANAAATAERIITELAARLEDTPEIARNSPSLLRTPVSAVTPAPR